MLSLVFTAVFVLFIGTNIYMANVDLVTMGAYNCGAYVPFDRLF
jgi:hypothetical protein